MAKELIDILTRAAEVRDETGAGENTASKVGSILTDLIDFIEEYQQSSSTAPVITTAQLANLTNFILSLAIIGPKSLTIQYTKPLSGELKAIVLNGATKNQAGVMTSEQVKTLESHSNSITQLSQELESLEIPSAIDSIVDLGIVNSSSVAEDRAVELAGNKDILFIHYETSNGQIGTIRQVYSYDGYSMQYLTLNGTEFVRVVYYDSGMKSVWRNINKASIVYKLLYDTGSRVLSFHDPIHDEGFGGITLPLASASNAGLLTNTQYQKLSAFNIYEGTPGADKVPVIFTNPLTGTTTTFNLMGATTARAGMMTTAHLRTLNDLTKNIYYLGDFTGGQATSNAAAEAAKKDVVSNPFIVVMYYTSWEADGGVIFQQVGQGQTLQYKFENGARWTRYIKFNNSGVTEVQPWQRDGVRNLSYNNSTRVLALQDMHSNNVGSNVTLPVGTTSVHGLLKLGTTTGTAYDGAAGKALADRITALETQLTNLTQS